METDDRKEHGFIELLYKAILTKWGLNVAPLKVPRRDRWESGAEREIKTQIEKAAEMDEIKEE